MEITSTKIADYLECPHKYYLVWIERQRPRVSAPLAFDRSLHRALAQHYLAGGPRVQPLAHLLGELAAAWQSQHYLDSREEQEYRAAAEQALTRFHEAERHNLAEVLTVSERWMMPLDGHTLVGTADRADGQPDGAVRVIDYRTGRHFPPDDPAAELLTSSLQLLARAHWPDRRVLLILHGLRQGQQVDVTLPEDQLADARERLKAVAMEIEAASRFPPRVGRACRSCGVKRWCRRRQQL